VALAAIMSKQLENLLRQSGLASDVQLRKVQERVDQGAGSLIEVLVKDERVSEDAIADAFTERLKVPRARVATFLPDQEALRKVPERLARKHQVLPLAVEGRVLVLAMANPADYLAIQDIEFASNMAVKPMAATVSEILEGVDERYGAEDRIGTFLANVPDAPDLQIVTEDQAALSVDVNDSAEATSVAPVVKMCNLLVYDALKSSASDVHIEPALHDLQVRMRVDGVLRDYTRVPKWLHGPVVSRLKILAKLDIAERRLPQDGRVNVQYQGRSVDLRVSTLPTHFGEKMVLRVLGGASAPAIDSLGLAPRHQRQLEAAVEQPQGMILVTGPTGSGKTTTLYALLAWHHKPEVNIVTVEDPIEFQLAGINQVQVNPKAGLTFASALRSILRQDPDVILVGEMRDHETVEIACQAAMTGHMVLSTLHTNSAVGAVTRMLDLGVDSAVLATSLTMVIAQRLVRRICNECREEYEPGEAVRNRVGMSGDRTPVYRGRGCSACGGTGFTGRIGIYEIYKPTNAIRKMINDRASEADMRMAARQAGMVPLREDALAKIRAGITSPDEVLRVVQVDENEVPCPGCKALIEADFATCPYCRKNLKTNCRSCGQALRLDWPLCPYCNTPPAPESDAGAPQPVKVEVAVSMPGTAVTAEPARETEAARSAAPAAQEAAPAVGRQIVPEEAPAADPEPAPMAEAAAIIEPTSLSERVVVFASQFPAEQPPPVKPLASAEPVSVLEPAPAAQPEPASVEPELNLAVPEPVVQEEPATPVVARVDPNAGRRPLRALVVDDDPDIRMIVTATLRKMPVPMEVVQAQDGFEALEKAREATPDLVVLDVMMPRIDGFETCRELRKNVRTAFVPILMLTASADQDSRTKGYLIGTDDYMAKPFLPVDLKLRIARLLRRTYGI
jgi:type IV pilus assembly protein PilB